ncbi:hypothetical protein J4714_11595, partial [Staphylococcus epidermidis]|nr:hypothetical protein [Staphylococcus epidermidis]
LFAHSIPPRFSKDNSNIIFTLQGKAKLIKSLSGLASIGFASHLRSSDVSLLGNIPKPLMDFSDKNSG